jgi:hypothetical protein
MRGWSGMRAAIDTEIEITETEAGRCAEVTKQRDLDGKGDRYGFRLEGVRIGINRWHAERTSCVVVSIDAPPKATKGKKPSAIAGAIEVYLRQRGSGMKRSELQKVLSNDPYRWNYGSVRNELGRMLESKTLLMTAGVVAWALASWGVHE